ncbi:MAG: HAD-IA family hydrolase, partial [Candidatus Micrarchaeota archaeon]
EEALHLLLEKGYRLGAFSNSVTSFNTPWLEFWGFSNLLEVVLTSEEIARRKPHADGIHAVCQKMGVAPEDCFYVGDVASDAVAAKSAGCKTALLLSGFGTQKILEKEKPDLVCKSLLDFAEKLPSLK